MGDMKIQKRYNEYLECLGDNITDAEKVMESIKKIINEETFEDMQKLYLLGIILQRNGMEYIHALKKRAVKSDNEIVKLNKVIKEKDKEIEKLNVDMESKDNKLAKFRAKNAELGQKAVKFQQELEKLNGMSVKPKAPTIPKNVVPHDTLYKSNGEKKKVVIVKKKPTAW